jgi:hypothetical protein
MSKFDVRRINRLPILLVKILQWIKINLCNKPKQPTASPFWNMEYTYAHRLYGEDKGKFIRTGKIR